MEEKNPLDAAALRAQLAGCALAREVIVLNETTSTNDFAAQLGREGVAEGMVVFAETQTAGRGRLGRRWEMSAGEGLAFSLLLRPQLATNQWTRLTTFAAVAGAVAIENEIHTGTAIKWPNDLYLDGRKVAGILIETHSAAEGFAVLGIGINVNQLEFPEAIRDRATSLRRVAGRQLNREKVAAGFLRQLAHFYPKLDAHFPELIAAAEARNWLRGRRVEAAGAGLEACGIAGQLDENGALILRKSDGGVLTLCSGEVTLTGS